MYLIFIFIVSDYKVSGKLQNKVVVIIGGDSGIGCFVVYYYVKEGVNVVIIYFNEYDDVNEIKK